MIYTPTLAPHTSESALLDHMSPEQTSAVGLLPGMAGQWLRGVACYLGNILGHILDTVQDN